MKPILRAALSAFVVTVFASLPCAAQNNLADSALPDTARQEFQKSISSVLESLTFAASASGESGDTWKSVATEALRLSRKDVRAEARDLGNASYSLQLKAVDNGFLIPRSAAQRALERAGLEHHRTFFNAAGFITTSSLTRDADGVATYYQINALVIEPKGCRGRTNQDSKGLYCVLYVTAARVELAKDSVKTIQDERSSSLVKAVAATFER